MRIPVLQRAVYFSSGLIGIVPDFFLLEQDCVFMVPRNDVD